MPGAVRKAEAPLRSEPASKKARTSAKSDAKSLKTAVFGNGKKLDAKLTSGGQSRSARGHAVTDRATKIVTTVGQEPDPGNKSHHDVIEISSDGSSSDDDEDEEEESDEEDAVNGTENVASAAADDKDEQTNGVESDKENQMDVDPSDPEAGPSFGELVANTAEPINVAAALQVKNDASSQDNPAGRILAPPSATSLATVLTQALRTNDRDLLESCFSIHDLESVRATISRLPSPLVESLLLALADKLHKRPGRANNLMVWVQWSLVSHGGYLATRRDVVARLGQLNRVIRERANGLQPLLALKGRLDMLWAQLELRRGAGEEARQLDEDEEDGVVVYVEGDEDQVEKVLGNDEDEDLDIDLDDLTHLSADALARLQEEDDSEDVDEDSDEDVSDEGFSDQEEESEGEEEDESEEDEEEELELPPPTKKSKAKSK